jgi:hypothetical protein
MITSFFKPKKKDSSGTESNDQSGKENNIVVKKIKGDKSGEKSIPVGKEIKDPKFPMGITLVKKTLVKKVRSDNEIEIS